MNCREAKLTIAALTEGPVPEALAAHVRACPACAELLAADTQIRSTLAAHRASPSPYVLDRIRQEIAAPAKPLSWFERLSRNRPMKITLPVAAVAALLATLSSFPRSAEAKTPQEAFARMSAAVKASAGERTLIEFLTMRRPDGSSASVMVVDGQPVELGPDGTFSVRRNGKWFNFRQGRVPAGDLSSLPPRERASLRLIQEASRRTGRPMTDFVVRDGKVVDRAKVDAENRKNGFEIRFRLDLDPSHYRSMRFGADRDHLLLVPKAAAGQRYSVTLDPVSHLPKTALLQRNEQGRWVDAK